MRIQCLSALLLVASLARPALARPPAGLAVAPASGLFNEPVEEVQLDLSPGTAFEIHDVGEGAVTGRSPFLIAIRRARLAPGKILRISVSLDASTPPGIRVSFQPRSSQGGTCRAGSLLPGSSVPVFESAGGMVTASCELRWILDGFLPPRQAGSTLLTLHWKLESVAAAGPADRPFGAAGGTLEPGPRGAGDFGGRAAGLPARGERVHVAERPEGAERRRPPR